MLWVQLAVVLGAIFLGARLGSIGVGFAGGMGVLVLTLGLGLEPGAIPIDVILIIMSVIGAVAAMQVAGGLDYLVELAEKILRSKPKYITFLAPTVTYVMTLLAGTGHTAYSTLPVIAEVAKENGVRPSRPLSIAVIASQIAITASPVSAAVVVFSGFLEPYGIGYLDLLAICIPTSYAAVMLTAVVCNFLGVDLDKDSVYQERLKAGLITLRETKARQESKKGAGLSVVIFALSILAVVLYATAISGNVGLIENPVLPRDSAIMVFMMIAAGLITIFCKIDSGNILNAQTFKSGMSACVCVLGVAWLGNTFVGAHIDSIQALAGDVLNSYPWLLAVTLFFASMLLYSQAATTRALMPAALALVDPVTAIASFAAVSALFVLPTYPTLLAAVEMDETGSTRIGKLVFNHPFFLPGTICIALSVAFAFAFAPMIV
ncbi:anaerobic C4-dicarboxylate transporter [Endozoicomonas arenosclerae]|uniref:anaerobic C4-dicarboxylate transporter n=1 Tax=Endozoicomonas arenosclerae TaxID=1633495 RepID=UPI000781A40C|nr:anaerobic C4-dicarboxylate transporter [Endozoicomonas arenosclerae]